MGNNCTKEPAAALTYGMSDELRNSDMLSRVQNLSHEDKTCLIRFIYRTEEPDTTAYTVSRINDDLGKYPEIGYPEPLLKDRKKLYRARHIPQTATNNDNSFAIIIANETCQEEAKVEYALNDGEMFKEYCHKVIGIPEENIHIRKDATLNNIKAELSWMQQVAEVYDGQVRFIFFLCGSWYF